MGGRVRLQLDGPLARVTLSHPGKLNAMSRAMWRALRDVFVQVQADATVRCVVLAGEGGAFCAGGDIAEYPQFRFDPASLRAFHEDDVWGGLGAVLACDVPVIASIEGACMGAGLEIAACCDLRIAADTARFGAPIARLGFPMAPREIALVAGAAGEATVREMLLEAAVLDAAELKARGFLQRVFHHEALPAEVDAAAQRITVLAPQAARLNKQALRALRGTAPADAVLPGAYDYAASAEHREGIEAFLQKRSPRF